MALETYRASISLVHQSFISRFIRGWLKRMASELIGKLVVESIYKRIMGKVLKRSLYQVI